MGVEYKMIGVDGREYGPTSLEEIRAWSEDGRVGPSTLIWKTDDLRWLPAGERDELKWDLPLGFPEPDAPRPQVPPVLNDAQIAAGFGPRLAAYLTDFIIVQVIASLLSQPWAKDVQAMIVQLRALGPTPELDALMNFYMNSLPVILPLLLLYSLVSLVYYVGCNGRFGHTPGKWLLGIEIVTTRYTAINVPIAFRRYGGELLSFLTIGYGYLMILTHPERRALHDIIAGTRVVYRR